MLFDVTYDPHTGFDVTMEKGCQELLSFDLPSGHELVFLGDPVPRDLSAIRQGATIKQGNMDLEELFDLVPGHYYWFLWKGESLVCGSSFGGIYPVYVYKTGDTCHISSSSFHLARKHQVKQLDEQYLLERRLFNYPLFGRTPWKAIDRLPTHAALHFGENGIQVDRAFDVRDHFGDGGRSSGTDMDALCRLFEEECKLMLPKEPFALSFTGGFDGRTLLGAALKLDRRDLITYSFGRPGGSDVSLPERQAKKLGVQHVPIDLDDTYVKNHSFRSALAFMEMSDHNGNFGRPHYHYAAEQLSRSHGYLVTGNFGSELFRAMHQPGVMISRLLIRIFRSEDGSWRDDVKKVAGLEHHEAGNRLVQEIDDYLRTSAGLDSSERFYRFVFDEVFRKYFGPEIIVQSHFLRNRTPFLSLRFVQALNETMWSGVHSRLFEGNKFRRLKGQEFYASFLRSANDRLYAMATNKGYGPADVIEPWRLPMLAIKVGLRRFVVKEEVDSNAVEAFVAMHGRAIETHYGLQERSDGNHDPTGDCSERIRVMSYRCAWSAAKAVSDLNR